MRRLAAAMLAAAVLGGCVAAGEHLGYYWQSASGHLRILRQAEPIETLIARGDVDPKLRVRLQLVSEIRGFASRELGLPDNGSYTRYADLQRPYVLWNVFATPELSMKLQQWCFPVAGCVSYRGYYDQAQAQHYAQQLRDAGLEAHVAGVPAYSTLGWFDDPVLSTFVHYSEGELARLIFHELAHQLIFVAGDTTFNESFATAVEEIGVERWLAARADPQLKEVHRQRVARKHDFVSLLRRYRGELGAMYGLAIPDEEKRQRKSKLFDALRHDYAALRHDWGGFSGYDRWFAQPLTNAHLAAVGTYNELVPAFRAMLARRDGDLPAFFADVRRLAALPKEQRTAQLREITPAPAIRHAGVDDRSPAGDS
ncbi:MAG TPA: aminopeptidase [Burkholderiaceae bacterium]|nr:aminopeptidase [Burkholderiaceae bacterium]